VDGFLDPSLLGRLSGGAGFDRAAVVLGEVPVARRQHRRLAQRRREHRRLTVIDHDFRAHAAEVLEGVLVAGQEVLLRLGQGELDEHPPAVTQHHDEERKLAPGGAGPQPAGRTPIHLAHPGRCANGSVSKAGPRVGRTWRT